MTFVYKLYLHTSFSNMAQLQNISSICLQIVKSIFYGPSFKFLDLPLKNAVERLSLKKSIIVPHIKVD